MRENFDLPASMAAVCISDDGAPVIKKVPLPHPGQGEVLVKVAAAPINPSDLARIRNLSVDERNVFIAGIEGSGLVVKSGRGLVPSLWAGKRVACSASRHDSGSWAEYMVTSAMACIPLPKTVDFEQGSMMLVNPLTAVAFSQMIRKGRHQAAINTASASVLGRMIEFLCKKQHIPLIQIVRNEKQQVQLQSTANYVLNSSSPDFPENLRSLALKLNATILFDAIGGELSKYLFKALPFGGTHVVYGNLSGEDPLTDHRSLISDKKSISGFYLVNWLKEQHMGSMLAAIVKARNMLKEDIKIPVQARYPLAATNEAIEKYLSAMSAGKVILQSENLKM